MTSTTPEAGGVPPYVPPTAPQPDAPAVEGHVVGSEPAHVWNPLQRPEPITVPIERSRDPEDPSRFASVIYQRWGGRERLAYEDAITERLLTTDERTGDDTIRLGSLRLFAVSLTIKGSTGFELFGMDGFLQGDRDKIEADLLLIGDPDTYSEIVAAALKVQPLPRADGSSAPTEEDASDGDPSRTLSTSPAAAIAQPAESAASASPVA